MMDDTVYDGTGLPPASVAAPEAPPVPEAPQSDGDGPAYEAVAGGPVPESVTVEPETVAVSTPAPAEERPRGFMGSIFGTQQSQSDTTP